MSLSSFHLIFISVCVLCAAGAGAWGVLEYTSEGSMAGLAYGVLSLAAVPALLVYAVRVRRKLRELPA